jgi:hypothetical protein
MSDGKDEWPSYSQIATEGENILRHVKSRWRIDWTIGHYPLSKDAKKSSSSAALIKVSQTPNYIEINREVGIVPKGGLSEKFKEDRIK